MKTKHGFRGFFGVSAKLPLALAVLLMFAVSACDDPDSGNGPKLPTELQNTEWVHTGGDRVKFGTDTVTVIPVSGTEKTFTLKDSVTVSELSQTTLYFGDGKTSDFILCRDGTISSVFLGGVEKANGWQKVNGSGNGIVPVNLSKNVQLTETNWKNILTEIETAGKYVNLDLSLCTRSGQNTGGGLRSDGTFDPIYDFSTGKNRIVSLILPNEATSIERGNPVNQGYPSFEYFSNLTSVSSPTVTNIGEYAFKRCTSLTSVSFPAVISIGSYAFSSTGATALTIILGSTAPTCSAGVFFSTYYKTVTVKVPASATGYGTIPTYSGTDTTVCWGNGFRGAGWRVDNPDYFYSEYINSNITLHIEHQ